MNEFKVDVEDGKLYLTVSNGPAFTVYELPKEICGKIRYETEKQEYIDTVTEFCKKNDYDCTKEMITSIAFDYMRENEPYTNPDYRMDLLTELVEEEIERQKELEGMEK